MSYQEITYSVEERIATVTLNRPEQMNALTPSMLKELHDAFDKADADRSVKVIIFTGAGPAFSAGFDQGRKPANGVRAIDPKGKSPAEYIEYWQRHDGEGMVRWEHMWKLGKPIIAAVNGWAMGGGFWYQLAADITIASDKAVFAQPEVRHISNTTFMFTYLCGWKHANRWALTGDHFDAAEALRIGLVNEVVPHDQLIPHCRALAKRLANVPEPALRLNKAIAMQGIQAAGLHAGLLLESALGSMAHTSHNDERQRLFEAQEKGGLKAYLELRDGPFQPEPMGPKSAKGRAERDKQKGKKA